MFLAIHLLSINTVSTQWLKWPGQACGGEFGTHSALEMLHDSVLYKFMIDIDIGIG